MYIHGYRSIYLSTYLEGFLVALEVLSSYEVLSTVLYRAPLSILIFPKSLGVSVPD